MFEFRKAALASIAAMAMALLPGEAFSLEAAGVLKRASDAMGATDLRTLRYVGSGSGASFEQVFKSGGSRPKLNLQRYVRSINYETASLSEETTGQQGGGGGLPLVGQPGERRGYTFVSGPYAWNMTGTTANPAALALTGRVHDLWITPHGVIKAAIRNSATFEWKIQGGKSLAAVSFAEAGRFKATAYINDKYLVERVESRLRLPVLGETTVVTWYSEYQSFGPIMFPMQIRQAVGGHMILDITVREAQPNAPINVSVPESVRTAR